MRYVKIKDSLYLAEQFVDSGKQQNINKKSAGGAINHIWIYDRSGSMYSTLPQLASDLIAKAKEIPTGDTLTLGWFSSEGGQFNFMLKGFKITEKRDYKILEETINKNKAAMGCTCFSEILTDAETVIKDLSVFSNNFALMFLTDGYPVVSSYQKEINAINSAIDKINSKVTSSLLVGYGNYYNKQLMTDMSARFGGSLIHSESLPEFSIRMDGFMKDARENGLKIMVDLEAQTSKESLVFGINGQQINIYQPSGNQIEFIPTQASRDSLYMLTEKQPRGEEVKLPECDLLRPTNRESLIRGVYAAACLLTQKTKSDIAMEVLSVIGDKDMIDSVANAFTNAEYGRAESKMQEAVVNRKRRFMQGVKMSYLPKEDAFCVLDVIKLLMQDDKSYFYPYRPEFEYKKIGVRTKTKEGYPEFEAKQGMIKCPLNKMTWNKSMLNLSVLANIPGHVTLTGDFKKHGFTNPYPTFVWRNYALIKDGFLNVSNLPVSMSEETYDKFVGEGLLDGNAWSNDDQIFVLDLTKIPVINRSIAKGKNSAADLCKRVYREIGLQATLKAYGWLREQIDPQGTSDLGKGALTADQELYLKGQGIGKNGFSPPVENLPSTDFYMAKEFEIKVKGLSSLPKVEDVVEKSMKGGKLTAGMLLVKSGLDQYNNNLKKSASDKIKLAWIDEEIANAKKELVAVRSNIQETKFSILLGKQWFKEFASRENNVLNLDGVEYTLSVNETKVEL